MGVESVVPTGTSRKWWARMADITLDAGVASYGSADIF